MTALYAPEYYKNFKCIADKCKHSCCIGWEIDIDSQTLEKYKKLDHPYSEKIMSNISWEETPHFKLGLNQRCPHLNQQGLCEIILNVGEDYLCHICREHPRFYNDGNGQREVGIGMSCEEACRLILTSENYNIVPIGHIEDEITENKFDTLSLRNEIYNILNCENITYKERLQAIYERFQISPCDISDEDWRELINSLEYLDDTHKERFLSYSSTPTQPKEYEKILERVLAYFIYRHCTEAVDCYDYQARLGFCLFCERLFASVLKETTPKEFDSIVSIGVMISEEIEYSEDNTQEIMYY